MSKAQVEALLRQPSDRELRNGVETERQGYMSDSEFQFLYNKVKSKSFKDEQMELLQMGCQDCRFSCAQCRRMMSIYT